MPQERNTALDAIFAQIEELKRTGGNVYSPPVQAPSYQVPDDDYTKYLQQGQLPTRLEDLEFQRAVHQPTGEQALHAGGRILTNTVPKIIGYTASVFDFDNELGKDHDYTNWLTQAMLDFSEDMNKSMPIYRERPDEFLDVGDFAWWAQHGSNLVQEAAAFYAAGLGVGSLVQKGAQALKFSQHLAKGKNIAAAAKGAADLSKMGRAGQFMTQGGTAFALNKVESTLVAADVYKNAYETAMQTHGDEAKANDQAAQAAAFSYNTNRMNILLNMTMAGRIMKGATVTRQATKALTKMNTLKSVAFEAGQEALEESINLFSEKEGERYVSALLNEKNHKRTLQNFLSDVMTAEGAESALLGAAGGGMMTMAAVGGSYVPTPTRVTDPKTGKVTTKWDSKVDQHNARRKRQQDLLDPIASSLKGEGNTDMFSVMQSAEKQANNTLFLDTADQLLNSKLTKAEKEAIINEAGNNLYQHADETDADFKKRIDDFKALLNLSKTDLRKFKEGRSKMVLEEQVWQFSENGGLDELVSLYDQIEDMDAETAEKKGFTEDYQEKARAAKDYIAGEENAFGVRTGGLAKIYEDHAGSYAKPVVRHLFDNRVEYHQISEEQKALEKEMAAYSVSKNTVDDLEIHPEYITRKKQYDKNQLDLENLDEAYKEATTEEGQKRIEASAKSKIEKMLKDIHGLSEFKNRVEGLLEGQEAGEKVVKTNDQGEVVDEFTITKKGDEYFIKSDNKGRKKKLTAKNINEYDVYDAEGWKEYTQERQDNLELQHRVKGLEKIIDSNEYELQKNEKEIELLEKQLADANEALEKALHTLKTGARGKAYAAKSRSPIAKAARASLDAAVATIEANQKQLVLLNQVKDALTSNLEILKLEKASAEAGKKTNYYERHKGAKALLKQPVINPNDYLDDTSDAIDRIELRLQELEALRDILEHLVHNSESFSRILKAYKVMFYNRATTDENIIAALDKIAEHDPEAVAAVESPELVEYLKAYLDNKFFREGKASDIDEFFATKEEIKKLKAQLQRLEEHRQEVIENWDANRAEELAERQGRSWAEGYVAMYPQIRDMAIGAREKALQGIKNDKSSSASAEVIMGKSTVNPAVLPPQHQTTEESRKKYNSAKKTTLSATAGRETEVTEDDEGFLVDERDEKGRIVPNKGSVNEKTGEVDLEDGENLKRWYKFINSIDDATDYVLKLVVYQKGDKESDKVFTKAEKAWNKAHPKHVAIKAVLYTKDGKPVKVDKKLVFNSIHSPDFVDNIAEDPLIVDYLSSLFKDDPAPIVGQYKGEKKVTMDRGDGSREYKRSELLELAKEHAKKRLTKLRDKVAKNTKKGKPSYVEATGLSVGVPNTLPTVDGVRARNSVTTAIAPLSPPKGKKGKHITGLHIPQDANDKEGLEIETSMSFTPGVVYITTSDGRIVEGISRTMKPQETEFLMKLFYHVFGQSDSFNVKYHTKGKDGKKTIETWKVLGSGSKKTAVGIIDKLIYFGKLQPEKSKTYEIYYDTTLNRIVFGDASTQVDPNDIMVDGKLSEDPAVQELMNFVGNLTHNVNKKLMTGKKYKHPVSIDENGVVTMVDYTVKDTPDHLMPYERFVLDSNRDVLGTDLVEHTSDENQFLSRYLTYDPVVKDKIERKVEKDEEAEKAKEAAKKEGETTETKEKTEPATPANTLPQQPGEALKYEAIEVGKKYLIDMSPAEVERKFAVIINEDNSVSLYTHNIDGERVPYYEKEGKAITLTEKGKTGLDNYVRVLQLALSKNEEELSEADQRRFEIMKVSTYTEIVKAVANNRAKKKIEKVESKKEEKKKGKKRLVKLGVKDYKKINSDEAESWLKSVFGDHITVEEGENLFAEGSFAEVVGSVFRISKMAEVGTEFHEAFHYVAELLSKQEYADMMTEARTVFSVNEISAMLSMLVDAGVLGKTADGYLDQNGYKMDQRAAEEYALEELIAEDFREYMMTEESRFSPKSKSFFQMIVDAIQNLVAYFKDTPSTTFKIYENIKGGVYKNTPTPSDKKSYRKIRLMTDYGTMTVNAQHTYEFFEGLSARLFQELFQDGDAKSLFATSPEKINKILVSIIDDAYITTNNNFVDKEMPQSVEDLLNILDNHESKTNQRAHYDHIIKEFYEFVKQYGIDLKEVSEQSQDWDAIAEAVSEDERTGYSSFTKVAAEYDTKNGTPRAIRMLIASIPTDEINSLGLDTMMPFGRTYIQMAKQVAGSVGNYDRMTTKLGDETFLADKPVIATFLDRLESFSKKDEAGERLRTQFTVEFSLFDKTFLTTILEHDGRIYNADTNNTRVEKVIIADWESAFMTILETKGGQLIWPSGFLTKFKNTVVGIADLDAKAQPKAIKKAFKMLGINFTNFNAAHKIVLPNGPGKTIGLRQMLNYINTELPKLNPNEVFKRQKKGGIYGHLQKLAQIEAKHTTKHIDLQSQASDGKTIYNLGLHTNLTITVSLINDIVELYPTQEGRETALRKTLPHLFGKYQENSLWKKDIIEHGLKIELTDAEGLRVNRPGITGKRLKGVTTPDRLTMFVNSAMDNIFPFMRAADRGVENTFKVGDDLLVTDEDQMVDVMANYLKDELSSSRDLKHNKVGEDVLYYQTNALELRIFKNILGEALNKKAQKIIDNTRDGIDKFVNSYEVRTKIRDWVEEQVDEETTNIDKEKVTKEYKAKVKGKGVTRYAGIDVEHIRTHGSVEKVIELFTYNSIVAYIEQTKLFTGDPAFYSSVGDNFKRNSMFNSTKKISRNDKKFNKWLTKHRPKQGGKKKNTLKGLISTIVYNDHKITSDYVEDLRKVFTDSFAKDNEITKNNVDFAQKVNNYLGPYQKIDEADAFGIVTLQEYRHILERAAQWTDKHEALYQKVMTDDLTLTPSEIFYFQPLKTQYTGPLHDYRDTLFVPSGYKHVIMPIFPQLLNQNGESNLSPLYNHMVENDIGIAQFHSGNKYGTLVPDTEPQAFYTEDNHVNLDVITQTIDYQYFGIQVDIAPKVKTETTPGSQAMKHVLSNIFRNGQIASEMKNYDIHKDVGDYIENTKKLVNLHLSNLKNRFGINSDYEIKNKAEFKRYLKEEFLKRNPDDNVLTAIQELTDDGTFIDNLANHRKVENLLMALVQNNVMRAKRYGKAMVQIPTTGFEPIGTAKQGSNYLKFYREGLIYKPNGSYEVHGDGTPKKEILPMEVEIPLPKEYMSFVQKHFKTLDAFNKAIEEGHEKVDERLLKIVGFRIPTQGMNSIEYMKIKRFLPPQSAEIIRVSSEIVSKTGSDYDVDKLTIYFPNFNFEKGIPRYTEHSDTKKGIENALLQSQINLIKRIENHRGLVAPIDDKILKDVAAEIKQIKNEKAIKKNADPNTPPGERVKIHDEASYTSLITPRTNIKKFNEFLAGKQGVAIGAIQGTHHVLSQQAGLQVADKFAKVFFAHNEIDGNISLSHTHDKEGNLISETLAAFLTAYVDIAKNPYIFDLNFTTEVANTVFYMLRAGADPVWVAYLVAQPKVEQYIKESARNKAEIFKDRSNKSMRLRVSEKQLVSKLFKGSNTLIDNTLHRMQEKRRLLMVQGDDVEGLEERITNKIDSFTVLKTEGVKTLKQNLINHKGDEQRQYDYLDTFLEYKRQSTYLDDLVRASNVDTKGVGQSMMDIHNREKLQQQINDDGFFKNHKALFSNTILQPFQETINETKKIYTPLYLTFQDRFSKLVDFKDLISSLQITNDKNNAYQRVSDDFLLYTMMTLKNSQGDIPLRASEYHTLLKGDTSVAHTINRIKVDPTHELYAQLHDNPYIKQLIGETYVDRQEGDLVKMFHKRLSTPEINKLFDHFMEIKQIAPDLATDLVKVSLIQAGFNTTPNSYSHIVPKAAIDEFLKSVQGSVPTDDAALNEWLENFKAQFQRNTSNHKFLPKITMSRDSFTDQMKVDPVNTHTKNGKFDFFLYITRKGDDDHRVIYTTKQTYLKKSIKHKMLWSDVNSRPLGGMNQKYYYPFSEEEAMREAIAEEELLTKEELLEDYEQNPDKKHDCSPQKKPY